MLLSEIKSRLTKFPGLVKQSGYYYKFEPGDGTSYRMGIFPIDNESGREIISGCSEGEWALVVLFLNNSVYPLRLDLPFDESRMAYIKEKFNVSEYTAGIMCLLLANLLF